MPVTAITLENRRTHMPAEVDVVKEDGSLDQKAMGQLFDNLDKKIVPERDDDEKAGEDDETKTPPTDTGDEKETADEKVEEDDVADDGETQTGDEDPWMSTDDAKELIESLGLSEEVVREMTGIDELRRHQQLLDKWLAEAGKKAGEKASEEESTSAEDEARDRATEQKRGEDGRFVAADAEGEKISANLDPEEFHQELIDGVEGMGNTLLARIRQLESKLSEMTAQAAVTQDRVTLDTIIDSWKMDDLFGTGDKPNRTNREEVRKAVTTLQAGLRAGGQESQLTPALGRRARDMVFASEISKRERDSFNKTVRKQAKTKLGGVEGQRKATGEKEWEGSPLKDPHLHKLHRQMVEEGV
jgi:hypothetical protein